MIVFDSSFDCFLFLFSISFFLADLSKLLYLQKLVLQLYSHKKVKTNIANFSPVLIFMTKLFANLFWLVVYEIKKLFLKIKKQWHSSHLLREVKLNNPDIFTYISPS
ncbi:hypothetical protein C4F50_15880 [Flavobacterium sp. KB82]|uniref:Uncharacterized protein n=1 Tax=Flavobacterium hungaricum TaxID=2082725 RepID=A0ABR9TM24_9FLAO|nr:hypothetical protein [Flavobacterium hungaricum]